MFTLKFLSSTERGEITEVHQAPNYYVEPDKESRGYIVTFTPPGHDAAMRFALRVDHEPHEWHRLFVMNDQGATVDSFRVYPKEIVKEA